MYLQHSKSRETSFSKPELKRGTSRTDLIRQLSKQRSILEQQAAAEETEAAKKNVLITEEKAETGSVSGHTHTSQYTLLHSLTECTHSLNVLAGFNFFSPRNVCSCYISG